MSKHTDMVTPMMIMDTLMAKILNTGGPNKPINNTKKMKSSKKTLLTYPHKKVLSPKYNTAMAMLTIMDTPTVMEGTPTATEDTLIAMEATDTDTVMDTVKLTPK